MNVCLIGAGCGVTQLTEEAREALRKASFVTGAQRLVAACTFVTCPREPMTRPEEILDELLKREPQEACILLSGDSGFYSGAAKLVPMLEEKGFHVRVLPGISSMQVLAARLKRPWQDWKLASGHGVFCDPLEQIMCARPVFFLTSGKDAPAAIARALTDAGLGDLMITVGQDLGSAKEKIVCEKASSIRQMEFSALNVVLTEAAPCYEKRTPGIPDAEFIREKIPMTKQEVRAAALAKLALQPQDVCWDIGAGTGSVSVEMALHAGAVWAIEQKEEAFELARRNREKFCAWNMRLIRGTAPEDLAGFPDPDAVFIGGSGGRLEEILTLISKRAPKARVCVSAIALETLQKAYSVMQKLGYETEVTQVAVSRSKKAADLSLLLAQNPVFLISGAKK